MTNCDGEKKRLLMQLLRREGGNTTQRMAKRSCLLIDSEMDECEMQTFPCAYCSKRVTFKQLPRHIENCADRLLKEAGASKLKGTRAYKRADRCQDLEHIENTNVQKFCQLLLLKKFQH